ncbi:MAG TPA: DUF6496 domain-containing protein [Clostridia bacterium]|nr:DUF6496 domain-containing protein [Clostridia bacterium]
MPERKTIQRAQADKRQGKAPTTQAGEFVREEIHHIRGGKHGARSAKQAIAIGLSKARRAGVKLPPPKKGTVSEKTRRSAALAYQKGQAGVKPSPKRSRARLQALRREGRQSASKSALSRQARRGASGQSQKPRSATTQRRAPTRSTSRPASRRSR